MNEKTLGTEALSHRRAPPTPLKLLVVEGPDRGRELLLGEGTYRVGKGSDAELKLTDGAVSRLHLVIKVLDGAIKASDTTSRNGSFVDGVRFSEIEVAPGTRIALGRSVLELMTVSREKVSSDRETLGKLWGRSAVMRALFDTLEKAALSDADICLLGESGTGKELCAEAIHQHSKRAQKPFIVCDLAGLSAQLFESELFGHVRGAFTGASQARTGALERANTGTVFLDEVGELPLDLQPKLLRFLERREVKPVGGDAWHKLDVRVVAATHRDLSALVADGRFREDLFHRLTVLTVRVPPLRERLDDVPGLVDRLLAQMGRPASTLAPKTRSLLKAHRWPGNVRELRNVVMKATHLGEADLGEEAEGSLGGAEPFHAAKERLITAFEVDYLKTLITRASGNVSRAARESGLDRVHLHRLLKKHNLDSK